MPIEQAQEELRTRALAEVGGIATVHQDQAQLMRAICWQAGYIAGYLPQRGWSNEDALALACFYEAKAMREVEALRALT